MLVSMTGFCSQSVTLELEEFGTLVLSIDLKSFNTRYFEAVCKWPSIFNHLEVKVIRLLQDKLLRGRVYLSVRVEGDSSIFENIVPSLNTAKGYIQAIDKIAQHTQVSPTINMADLVRLPGVFIEQKKNLSEKDETQILQSITQVAEHLLTVRLAEGRRLQDDFEKIMVTCSSKIDQINGHFLKFMSGQKEKAKQLAGQDLDGDEQARVQRDDLFSMLNKIDIHEEIVRFKSHLTELKSFLLSEKNEKGKRIDFILQELLRETNTMMAKCSQYEISSRCVDIKVELEKAREQVQNIV
ncbi:MAG: YicC family protein [Epsilonproteobacteria bacterium]|nr:YicC family protein [Campylobacterota bacterium]